jgi:hypothetical protein
MNLLYQPSYLHCDAYGIATILKIQPCALLTMLAVISHEYIIGYIKMEVFMRMKRITTLITAGLVATVMFPAFASAATNTVTVTDSDVARQLEDTPPTKNWVIYTRPTAPGTATFRTGPATPPLGNGSLELNTTTGSDKVYAFNFDHVGTKLSDVNAMGYSTYRSTGNLQQVAAINLQVDYNGPDVAGGFTTLVFEPVYNTSQGAVVSGSWQTWDAYSGGNATWWSSNPMPSAPNRDTFVSWSTIVAANPDATVLGGYGVNQGSGNPTLTTAVDALTFGASGNVITYNFDVKPVMATDKDQCKNGGYKNFQTEYKNQGDCVSSVASDGKAKGNPVR